MKILHYIIGAMLLAAASVLGNTSASAQEYYDQPDLTSYERDFGAPTWDGLYMVNPLVGMTAMEIYTYRRYGCAVSDSLFGDLVRRAIERGAMCGEWFFDKLDGRVEEGTTTEMKFRSSLGVRLVFYHKGISQSPNLLCMMLIPRNPVPGSSIPENCKDSASGGMTVAATLSNLVGNGGAMALGAFVGNVTAPRAGNTNINVGSASGSSSSSASEANAAAAASAATAASSQYFGRGGACQTTECE